MQDDNAAATGQQDDEFFGTSSTTQEESKDGAQGEGEDANTTMKQVIINKLKK